MFQFFEKTAIDFIGKRYLFFALSGLLAFLGLIAILQISLGKANMGIDFSGGAAIQLKFSQPIPLDDARKALEQAGLANAELQEVVDGNRLLIRLKKQNVVQQNIRERVGEAFSKAFPDNRFEIESSTEIGPTIGQKLQKDALVAITLSMLCIIAYIAFRFEFRFGVAAAIATFHDVLVVLGIFYILNKEVTLLIVTALLTIAGYSLTDTVVVFDRIRENLKTRRKESMEQVINDSINQILSRTFNTSLTTFLAVLAIYFFGGEVIHDFALAMILGVVVGTYSSWFVASPLLLFWQKRTGVLKRA